MKSLLWLKAVTAIVLAVMLITYTSEALARTAAIGTHATFVVLPRSEENGAEALKMNEPTVIYRETFEGGKVLSTAVSVL